jgi:hypothetical protein
LIRRNTIELQVEGKAKPFLRKLKTIPNVIHVDYSKHLIKIGIDDSTNYSKTLLNIFKTLSEEDLELISFNSGSDNLEEAFLNLLEEEKSHGFLRTISKNA